MPANLLKHLKKFYCDIMLFVGYKSNNFQNFALVVLLFDELMFYMSVMLSNTCIFINLYQASLVNYRRMYQFAFPMCSLYCILNRLSSCCMIYDFAVLVFQTTPVPHYIRMRSIYTPLLVIFFKLCISEKVKVSSSMVTTGRRLMICILLYYISIRKIMM